MCTVSWLHHDAGYHLLCNRDEKKNRLEARGPQLGLRSSVSFLSPTDRNHGGTWIAVNEHAVAFCLLNGVGPNPAQPTSRGLIIPQLVDADSVDQVWLKIARMNLDTFAPFTLVTIEPQSQASVCSWNGSQLNIVQQADHLMPLTSSSFNPVEVNSRRQSEFLRRVAAARVLDEQVLFQFHESHGFPTGSPSAHSICMHRDDAMTVSFSWVNVTNQEVSVFYSPASPCTWTPGQTVRLARRISQGGTNAGLALAHCAGHPRQ